MKGQPEHEPWESEFQAFLDAPEIAPSGEVRERIMEQVRRDLQPPPWAVFGKMALVALAAGMASLLL